MKPTTVSTHLLSRVISSITEDDARRRFMQARWPDGFVCPACRAAAEPWPASRNRLICSACGHQASITAGTALQDTRKPLIDWLRAIWLMLSEREGISARRLMRELGISSYPTAWKWERQIRNLIVGIEKPVLKGTVDVSRLVVHCKPSRGVPKADVTVLVASESAPTPSGKVRMAVNDGSPEAVRAFIDAAVATDATVVFFEKVATPEAAQSAQIRRKSPAQDCELAHQVHDELLNWLRHTHRGRVSAKHLDAYLQEFAFRRNACTEDATADAIHTVVTQAMRTAACTQRCA